MPRKSNSAARRPSSLAKKVESATSDVDPTTLRIIGGQLRGRKIRYRGDRRTRPMKDRVREAVFNLLGPDVRGALAIDLFAGTGALGLEAVSRGAAGALMVERHFPTAAVLRENVATLGLVAVCRVLATDTFVWARRQWPPSGAITSDLVRSTAAESTEHVSLDVHARGGRPWVVFCSPPYDMYVDRHADLLALLTTLLAHAPPGSLLAVECDSRFDPAALPQAGAWDVRTYPPAVVAIFRQGTP
jgi:16S rRNA G966 N2-methylase RsmD